MATLDDIAREAGVSKWTVARVLKGQSKGAWKSSAARAEKIRRIAQEMHYLPNAAARATATGRFHAVAFMLRFGRPLPVDLLQGVVETLEHHGIHTTLAPQPPDDAPIDRASPKVLRELGVDGLLIDYGTTRWERLPQVLREQGVPAVYLNEKLENNAVRPDDAGVARTIAREFLERGHRRIGYASAPYADTSSHFSENERRDAFVSTLAEAGVTAQLMQPIATAAQRMQEGEDPRYVAFRAWLDRPDRPTAVFAYNSGAAHPLGLAAAALNLAVPEDLSISTIISGEDQSGLRLRRYWLPVREIGETGATMLLERIEEPGRSLPSVTIPFNAPVGPATARVD